MIMYIQWTICILLCYFSLSKFLQKSSSQSENNQLFLKKINFGCLRIIRYNSKLEMMNGKIELSIIFCVKELDWVVFKQYSLFDNSLNIWDGGLN